MTKATKRKRYEDDSDDWSDEFQMPHRTTRSYQKQEKKGKIVSPKQEFKQCYGPGCTKPAIQESKYCSDKCGLALATK